MRRRAWHGAILLLVVLAAVGWLLSTPLAGSVPLKAWESAADGPPQPPHGETAALLRRAAALAVRIASLTAGLGDGGPAAQEALRRPLLRQIELLSLEQAATHETLRSLEPGAAAAAQELGAALAEQERLADLLEAARTAVLGAEAALALEVQPSDPGLPAALAAETARRRALEGELAALRAELAAERRTNGELRAALETRRRDSLGSLSGLLRLVGLDLETMLGQAVAASGAAGEPSAQAARARALVGLAAALPLSAPLESYRITSRFGEPRGTGSEATALHYGLDMAAASGTEVTSTASGTVTFAGWRGHYGRLVEVEHGHGFRTRYGHLKTIKVKRGQTVAKGESLGLVGSSGRSSGPHLHYEVLHHGRPLDPLRFLGAGRRLQESAALGTAN